MQLLRDRGYTVGIVERYLPSRPRPTKVDLWGLFDLAAISAPDDDGFRHIAFVQTTTGSNLAARRKKILASPVLPMLQESPGVLIVLHGWCAPTASRRTWRVREETF